MSFDRNGLSSNGNLASAGVGGRLWMYKSTADALAAMDTTGYFNGAVANGGAINELEIGDVIIAMQVAGTIRAPTSVTAIGFLVVITKTGGVLDTGNINSAAFTLTSAD